MAGKFNKFALGNGLLNEASKELATNDFKITYVPLENIHPNSNNNELSIDDIEDLKMSIKEVGLEQNLVVVPIGSTDYKILTGHRRYKALCELVAEGYTKYKTAPCVIKDIDKIELPLSNDTKEIYALATTNVENRRNTDADRIVLMNMLSQVYDELKSNGYEKLGRRREFIAEKLGVSDSTVKILSYVDNNISDTFRAELNNNNLALTVANEIAHLDVKQQDKLYSNTDDIDELSVQDIKDYAQKGNNKKARTINSLEHEDYIININDFEYLDKYSLGLSDDLPIDKKTKAALIDIQTSIEKQLQKAIKLIEKAQERYD